MKESQGWLDETEKFFFEGARSGWAGGNDGTELLEQYCTPGMVDWREVIHLDPLGFAGYHFADRWGTDPDSGRPSGSMIISHWDLPVWGMWVGGSVYDAKIYPFLRSVLRRTYSKRLFCGGRGPAEYRNRNFRYTNVYEGTFARFHGREQVECIEADGSLRLAGYHEYWGGSFVFLPRV